jgi:hypothetical protein
MPILTNTSILPSATNASLLLSVKWKTKIKQKQTTIDQSKLFCYMQHTLNFGKSQRFQRGRECGKL